MTCRICAGRLGTISKTMLEWLMHDKLPDWLDGLCPRCVYQVATENLPDYENPTEPATEILLDQWVAKFISEAARRIAAGQPILRCEAQSGWHGEDGDSQCDRFAGKEQRDGHNVCYACRGRFDRGKTPVYFIDQHAPYPEPYLIWATSPEDLIEQASTIAASLQMASVIS